MNTHSPTHSHPTTTDWHLLGELKLPASVNTGEATHVWLEELLNPLELAADFLNRVTRSVQESVTRVLKNSSLESGHLHLAVLVPSLHKSTGKPWGFFHIERVENQKDGTDAQDHAIDFYLYMEGE